MKSFKTPDIHAPRYRPQRTRLVNRALVEDINAHLKHSPALDRKDVLKIIETYNRQIWETAIAHRDGVELPERLGCIFLGRCLPKISTNTNFKSSAERQRIVEHKNWDSNDFLLKIFYTNHEGRYRFEDHKLWGFDAARVFTRAASAAFKDIWTRCIHIDHTFKIARLFRKRVFKQSSQEYEKRVLDTYDEFEL